MNQHTFLIVSIIGLLIIMSNSIQHATLAAVQGSSDNSNQFDIKIRHVKTLEIPPPIPGVSGNSHLLPGVAPSEPCFGVSYATTYEDCTAAFYNAKQELVATWREPVAGGDKVMCMTAGDLDGDGNNGSIRNNP